MICKQCGAQIEDNSAECKFCGALYETAEKIEEPNQAEVPVEEVPGINNDENETDMLFDENEIKRQRQIERMRAEKQSQLDEIEKRRKEKKLKQKRNKVLIVLIVLLCLGASAAAGYYVFKNSSDEPEIIVATQTTEPEVTAEATEAPTVSPSPSPTPAPSQSPVPTEGASWQATGNDNVNSSTNRVTSGGSANTSSGGGTSATNAASAPKATKKPAAKATPKPSTNASTVKPSTSTATMGGTEYNAEGGMSGDKFTSALVTGGEVVKSGDRTYMSFKHNGTTYYAKVSSNTTTNFIAGKAITLSAYKISETYNGVNVYEITSITHYNGSYIFPNSGFKLLTEADLAGKTVKELRLGRNEIYARHGRTFNDSSLQSYFNGCSWYKVKNSYDYSNDANNLNAIERANANFIRKYEKSH